MRKAFAAVSLILVCVFCFTFFAGCADVPEVNGSSNVASGEEVQGGGEAIQSENRGDGESNDAASKDSSSKRHTTVSRPASSDNKTSSFAGFVDTNSYGDGSEDEDEGTTSYSSGIKQYKNPRNLGLFACHLSLFWCNS